MEVSGTCKFGYHPNNIDNEINYTWINSLFISIDFVLWAIRIE